MFNFSLISFCVKELHIDFRVRDQLNSPNRPSLPLCDIPTTHVRGLRPFKGNGLRRFLTSCVLFSPAPNYWAWRET